MKIQSERISEEDIPTLHWSGKIKTGIKLIIFAVLLLLLLDGMGTVFLPYDSEETRQNTSFYEFPKNSVDVLIVGGSTVRNGISPNELWNQYGIVAYNRCDSRQAAEITTFNLRDSLKYQDPQLLIISLNQLYTSFDYDRNEPFIRKALDYKRFSADKLRTIMKVASHYEDSSEDVASLIFPALRYHIRWQELLRGDDETIDEFKMQLKPEHDYRRGQITIPRVRKNKVIHLDETDETVPEYDEYSYTQYKETIELAQKKGIDVLVVTLPDVKWTKGEYLGTAAFAEEMGVDYIDFNTEEVVGDIGFIWQTDLYDRHHLNPVGARKSSKYVGQYIIDRYGIPQHQCDESLAEQLDADWEIYDDMYNDFYKDVYTQVE